MSTWPRFYGWSVLAWWPQSPLACFSGDLAQLSVSASICRVANVRASPQQLTFRRNSRLWLWCGRRSTELPNPFEFATYRCTGSNGRHLDWSVCSFLSLVRETEPSCSTSSPSIVRLLIYTAKLLFRWKDRLSVSSLAALPPYLHARESQGSLSFKISKYFYLDSIFSYECKDIALELRWMEWEYRC